MKLLDRGYYYDVYDIGNDRVYKKRRNIFLTLVFLFFKYKERLWKLPDYIRYFLSVDKNLKHSYLELPRESFFVLANPVFDKDGINYTQDKCHVLKHVLCDISDGDFATWIDEYIQTIHATWSYGFSDVVFNVTVNTGKNVRGEIVQLDFNEITFNKEDLGRHLGRKYWTENFSFRQLSENQRKIFLEKMDKEINMERLGLLWRTRIST